MKRLGLALAVKLCPDQPQAFKKVFHSRAFPHEEFIIFSFFSERIFSRFFKA